MGYQIFVAISTGQQVANFPPILALAKKHDRVLWLESDFAKAKNWVEGGNEVLDKRGIKHVEAAIVGDMDEPGSVGDSLNAILPEMVGNACDRVCIVLNGGKKLTPIGLVFSMQEMDLPEQCEVLFLYGDNRPVQMKIHPSNIMGEQEIKRYRADRMLNVSEIFQLKGLNIKHDQRWVWGQPGSVDRYGSDADFTRLVHDCYARGFDEDSNPPSSISDWPSYQKWTERSKDIWAEEIAKRLARSAITASNEKLNDLTPSLAAVVRNFKPQVMQRELSKSEHENLARDGWIGENNSMQLGFRFEEAVWHRTVQFLISHPEYQSLVKECLLGIKVNRGGIQESELDVVLVLTNGILIHLECKTWAFTKKDADARTLILQNASSSLAIMVAVAPLFPSMHEEDWFQEMHVRFEALKSTIGKKNVIAFTMPNPPETYSIKVKKHREEVNSPPSFEESLNCLLKPYLPE